MGCGNTAEWGWIVKWMKLASVLVLVGLSVPMFSQTVPKNPTGLAWTCPDHALDDAHEIAIVRESDGVTIQTLAAGDPPLTGTEVVAALNVQPVAFGQYRFRVRALAAGVSSDWSELSEIWERAPGKPTGLVVR